MTHPPPPFVPALPPADRQLGAWIHAILNPFCDVDFHSKLYDRGFPEWRGVAAFLWEQRHSDGQDETGS